MKEPRSNTSLSDFPLNRQWYPTFCRQVSTSVLEVRVILANTTQKQKGFHYFSRQEQTPKGVGIKVNCLDVINSLFSSTCHLRLRCPQHTDKPYLTWSRNVFQDKIKKTITAHKLTALESFAKDVTLAGLTAV